MWTQSKIHLIWTPRKNFFAEMDSPWSTEGPHFMNNKSLMAIFWQGLLSTLCMLGRTPERTLSFLHCAWLVYTVWVIHCRETLVSPFYQQTDICPIHQKYTIWIPHLHKMNLIENLGRTYPIKKWSPLCLGGTQFTLLPESVSTGLQLLLLK